MKYIFILLFCSIGYSQGVANNPFVTFPESGIDLTGMFAYYRFDNNLNDSYGSYNGTGAFQGTGSTPSFTTGKINQSVVFVQGVNAEYMTITDDDVFTFSDGAGNDNPFSISFWIKSTGADNRAMIVNKRTGTVANTCEWQIFLETDGLVELSLFDSTGQTTFIKATFPLTLSSTWQHITFTYDGSESNTGITGYINGGAQSMTVGSGGTTYTGMANTPVNVFVGAFGQIPASSTLGLDGELDNLHFWSSELSATQVLDIYTQENGGTTIID